MIKVAFKTLGKVGLLNKWYWATTFAIKEKIKWVPTYPLHQDKSQMAQKSQGHKCSHKNDYKNQESFFKQYHARKPIFSLIQNSGAISERHRQIWDCKNRKFEMAKNIKWCQKQTGDKGSAQDRKGLVPQESHCCPREEPRAPDRTQWQQQQAQHSLPAMAHLWVGGAHAGQHSR